MRTDTTENQSQAARTNGAKSHGPVTPEGKARSAQNATRHGLTAKGVVLANESQQAFDDLLAEYWAHWQPCGPVEEDLVRDMVEARWRLRRIRAIETAAFDTDMFIQREAFDAAFTGATPEMRQADAFAAMNKINAAYVETLGKYEIRYERSYQRAVKMLNQLRKQNVKNEPKPAPVEQPPAPIAEPSGAAETTESNESTVRAATPIAWPRATRPFSYAANAPTPETFVWQATYQREAA